jgi:ABC-2 type transport system ATP-binding protein
LVIVQHSIVVKNLIKKYKKADKNSVDGISFEVEQGSFVAFLGPNGAGKTTTISILTTSLSQTGGDVIINGYDLLKHEKEIRKEIGIIFQEPSLDADLTCEENIRVHAGIYGIYNFRPLYKLMPREYKENIEELAELVDLKEVLHKPVKTLSGGMKRKLEVIRSLIHNPKILFLDEPTTGLDPISRRNIWEYLNLIRNQKGTTIFLTTHYLDEAEGCDKVIIINKGKILLEGSPKKIKNELTNDFLIVDSDNKLELEKEVKKLKIDYKKLEQGGFEINVKNTKEGQSIIQRLKTELTEFKMVQPTLEEAYIGLLERENNENEGI